jgi:hypothetical protein
MEYISHRINKVEDLIKLPTNYGVELDLRDMGDEIVISHDPYVGGECFEDYLKHYHHGTMILNIKSERIEHRVLEMIQKADVKTYFFLDASFPMIFLLSSQGESNIALRFSEYEGMDTIRNMAGRVNWVWVDCFTRFPLERAAFDEMKSLGYKLCLVSPELQGRDADIEAYKVICKERGIVFDAICTKTYNISRWKK